MAIIRNLVVKIAADISSLQKGLSDAQSQLNSFSRQMGNIGKTLTAGVTVPLTALGGIALNTAANFEQSMANAASVSGATAEELEKMTSVAREMGKSTVFSASEAADAMYYMASAGYKAGEMGEAIKPILDLAAATQSDLAFSTDTVIATLNQFGLKSQDAGKVTNIFAAAIGNSQATLDKLGTSMSYVGPVANSLGYSIEETSAALSQLYNAGFDGSKAGTVLRGALSRLMKPTKAVNDALVELGLTYGQVNPATNSIADIVGILGDKSITTAQAIAIFGQEAGPGMMALISQGSEALIEMEANLTGTDAAALMAEKQLDTFKGSMKLLKSAVEEVAIQFGNILIPILRDLVTGYVQPAVQWFSNLDEGVKRMIVTVAAIAAAIGPFFLILAGLAKGLSAVAGAVSFLISPIGLVIVGIAALTAGLIYLWNTNEDFRNTVVSIWQSISLAVASAIEGIKAWWDTYGEGIINTVTTVFTAIWTVVSTVLGQLWESLKVFFSYVEPIWEALKSLFMSLWNVIEQLWQLLEPVFIALGAIIAINMAIAVGAINGVIQALDPFILAVINAVSIIVDVIGLVIAVLRGDWSAAWDFMKSIAENTWQLIVNVFNTILGFIKGFVEGVISLFKGLWYALVGGSIIPDIVNGALSFFTNMLKGITETVGRIVKGVINGFKGVFNFISDTVKNAWSWGANLSKSLADGIRSGINAVGEATKSVANKIKGFLGFSSPTEEGPGSESDKWIPNLFDMLNAGIKEEIPKLNATLSAAMNPTIEPSSGMGMVRNIDTVMGNEDTLSKAVYQGVLDALKFSSMGAGNDQKEIVLKIDGTSFARAIIPNLMKEKQRGIGLVVK